MGKMIFIVGLPRSGSTLWLRILEQNLAVCSIDEILYLHPLKKDFRFFLKKNIGSLQEDAAIDKMLDLLLEAEVYEGVASNFFRTLQSEVDPMEFRQCFWGKFGGQTRDLGGVLVALLHAYREQKNKEVLCVKFPIYVNHLDKMFAWFPDAKVVHIVRDPRGIGLSRMQFKGQTKDPFTRFAGKSRLARILVLVYVSLQYNFAAMMHRRFEGRQNYALFSYEDLMHDPEEVVGELSAFCELEYNEQMLSPAAGQVSSINGEVAEGIRKERAYGWLQGLTKFEQRLVEFMTRTAARRFGIDAHGEANEKKEISLP